MDVNSQVLKIAAPRSEFVIGEAGIVRIQQDKQGRLLSNLVEFNGLERPTGIRGR